MVRNPCPSSLRCGGANLHGHTSAFSAPSPCWQPHMHGGESGVFSPCKRAFFGKPPVGKLSRKCYSPCLSRIEGCVDLPSFSKGKWCVLLPELVGCRVYPPPHQFWWETQTHWKPVPWRRCGQSKQSSKQSSLHHVLNRKSQKDWKSFITTDLEDPWGISQKTSQLKIVWAQNLETPSGTSQFATRVCSSARSRALAAFDKSACNGNADGWLPSGNVVMIAMENGHVVRWFTH